MMQNTVQFGISIHVSYNLTINITMAALKLCHRSACHSSYSEATTLVYVVVNSKLNRKH